MSAVPVVTSPVPDDVPLDPLEGAGGGDRPVARKWLWIWGGLITFAYALLWTPNWYPLSDSSLYLSMGRSFSQGRGLTMMGDPVRLVPPLTPMFLGTLMKLGAGIGTIQAVMIALMLVAHALCFLTLRRWTTERLALAATLACAMSYWVYANAFTIMSEPLCVALMWGGFLALSYVTLESRYRWRLVLLSTALLVLAAANRDAIFCLLPGPLLAVLLRARRDGRWSRESFAWAAIFAVVIGGWFFYRYPPKFIIARFTPRPTSMPATTQSTTQPGTQPTSSPVVAPPPPPPAVAINPEFEAEGDSKVREGRYKAVWMQGVRRDWHMLTEPPVLGGRWVCEGLVMASVAVFEAKGGDVAGNATKVLGTVAGLAAFAISVVGAVLLLRRGHWWVLGAAIYFAFIWLQWGTRIKPRYMVPIAPLLFLFLWSGFTWLVGVAARALKASPSVWRPRNIGPLVMVTLVVLIAAGNAYPWAVEVYVRHQTKRDFYDVARRSGYARLVDIGAYAQRHIAPEQVLWMNAGGHRRIAHFLSGHKIETSEQSVRDWRDWDMLLDENKAADALASGAATTQGSTTQGTTRPTTAPASAPATVPLAGKKHLTPQQRRRRFFIGIPKGAKYLIVMVDHPRKGDSWPGWHLPLRHEKGANEWWRLYERQPDDTWKMVKVPVERDYVRGIPPAFN